MDYLHIQALSVQTHIGTYGWEQQILQRLLLDISIPIKTSECQEKLENVIDYEVLCQKVTKLVESQSYKLIETVANQVADFLQAEYQLSSIRVTVSKPHAVKNSGNIQVVVDR